MAPLDCLCAPQIGYRPKFALLHLGVGMDGRLADRTSKGHLRQAANLGDSSCKLLVGSQGLLVFCILKQATQRSREAGAELSTYGRGKGGGSIHARQQERV